MRYERKDGKDCVRTVRAAGGIDFHGSLIFRHRQYTNMGTLLLCQTDYFQFSSR